MNEFSVVTGAEVVGATLAKLGVRAAFGVVGSGNFVATDALVRSGAQFYGARHESAATSMADAYWRTCGEVAVCSVHQGPGLTNTATALGEAAKSKVPLVVITGAVSAGALRSNFAMSQDRFAESVGCIAEQIYRPETVAQDTTRAYRRALQEQRPVVLSMPLDVQQALVPQEQQSAPGLHSTQTPTQPESAVLDEVAEKLLSAERPLILGGRGAWLAGAKAPLISLADQLGARLASTAVVKGLFDGHPRDIGIAGGFSHPQAVRTLSSADLILAVGATLTTWTTRGDTVFSENATVIQVDADPAALGLNARVDIGVNGDASLVSNALVKRAEAGESRTGAEWQSLPEASAPTEHQISTEQNRCHPFMLTERLEEMLPTQRTLVLDGGHFIGWPAMGWSVPDPAGFVFTSAGFQSIGLGLGAAVGAAISRPDRLTILASGDGGFLMGISELETMVRLQLPVLVIIYNDSAYGAEVHHFRGHGSGLELVQFPETDIAETARGVGAQSATVRNVAELSVLNTWLDRPSGPFILDAKVDTTVTGPWAEQDFAGH